MDQFDLFAADDPAAAPRWPEGFRYATDVLSADDEQRLLHEIRQLPFAAFEFHGYTGRRRTVAYGYDYDFTTEQLRRSHPMPHFLETLRDGLAQFAGREAASLTQVLVTEYEAGAGIGWHRDKGVFDEIIGLSLLAACTFRLRRAIPGQARWERVNLTAAPRAAYLLSGASRTEWEHSIPPVASLRFSVTFRSLRGRG